MFSQNLQPKFFCEDLKKKNLDFFYLKLPELTNDKLSESFEKFTCIDKQMSLKELSRC